MNNKALIAWLEGRAEAYFERYRFYMQRAARYSKTDFYSVANKQDAYIAEDLANQYLMMAVGIRNALRDIELKLSFDEIEKPEPPVYGSLSYVIESKQ